MHITKRPHKKTRTGCQSCKDRRVKCDEIEPQCTSCSVRDIQCEYPARARSTVSTPSTEEQSYKVFRNNTLSPKSRPFSSEIIVADKIPPNLFEPALFTNTKIHDMRLLHHYCTVTIDTLGVNQPLSASAIGVWQKEVPRLAFEHTFLLDNLLALASIHMDQMAPQSANYRLTALYQDKALRAFQQAVANFSMEIFLPVLVTSALMSPSSLFFNRNTDETRLWSPDWMIMHTGVGTILQAAAWEDVLKSSIGPIFQVQIADPAMNLIPPSLQQMLYSIENGAQRPPHHDILIESVTCLGRVYGGLAQNGLNQAMTIDIMRWPFAIPSRFMELTKEQEPHALIILAHFIIFFELLPQLWWVSDVARHDVEIIGALLGPKWEKFLEIPIAAVQIKDKNLVLDFLLGQLLDINTADCLYSESSYFGILEEFVALKDLDVNSIYREGYA